MMTGHGRVKALEKMKAKAKNEITLIDIQYNNGRDYTGIPSQDDIVGTIVNFLDYLDIGKISKIHFETAGRLIDFQEHVLRAMTLNQSLAPQEEK